MNETVVSSQQLKQNRRILLLIVGIPVMVFVLSSVLYFLAKNRMIDLGTVNNGELIKPPLQIAEMPIKNTDNTDFDYSQLEPKWSFVVFGDQFCTGDCEQMLYLARQSIIAMAKRMDRIRLVYVSTTHDISPSFQQRIEKEYQGVTVAVMSADEVKNMFAQTNMNTVNEKQFFVVDPRGWMMMTYQAENVEQETLNSLGKKIIADMKRLIK